MLPSHVLVVRAREASVGMTRSWASSRSFTKALGGRAGALKFRRNVQNKRFKNHFEHPNWFKVFAIRRPSTSTFNISV